MKAIHACLSLLFSLSAIAQSDYVIYLNDSTFDIDLNKEYQVVIDGKTINLRLAAKDTLFYQDDLYSFQYSNDYKVSKTEVDQGVNQIMIMTAEGSGILIQQYSNYNPTSLNELMLTEITKESLNYGFEMERQDYSRSLKSGQRLEVIKARLEYRDEINIYEIASIGGKDEGILVMTMRMDDFPGAAGEKIIELMWKSLQYQ